MSQFYVKVKPGQQSFDIDMSGDYPTVYLTQEASQGRANAELVRRLSDMLDEDVHIVSGHHSSRKKIAVEMAKEEALSLLA